jgi:hypothetical protein
VIGTLITYGLVTSIVGGGAKENKKSEENKDLGADA